MAIKDPTRKPRHTINLGAMMCGGNIKPNRRALEGAKNRGPTKQVRATLASIDRIIFCAPFGRDIQRGKVNRDEHY